MPVERRLKLLHCDAPLARSSAEPAVKIAFASADRRRVDQHFGAAAAFAIYAVDRNGCELLEVVQFGQLAMDGHEDKVSAKLDALKGCVAVYCQAVGASAVRQLRAQGIQPLKVPAGSLIKTLLRELQRELADGPSAWLARAMAMHQPCAKGCEKDRFDAMEAEGWCE
ncbi:nitrogen fixation protein NifX [Thiorhodovibrio winogradskyi]|uniref:Nitrogen fixation protein NifX n=1 Tax=Thiorhodovibrio winogradskyi TaxID=77007 RepID=A0ABZ0S6K9_9GAMM|nr:NifB/NifX family molybdenum-iron cluster-binding protein [Thiorhodovibrio winogradskyi]